MFVSLFDSLQTRLQLGFNAGIESDRTESIFGLDSWASTRAGLDRSRHVRV